MKNHKTISKLVLPLQVVVHALREVERTWIPTKSARIRWGMRGLAVVGVFALAVVLWPPQHVQGIVQGDGKLVYGEDTVTTPRIRDFLSNTFSAETSAGAATATIRHTSIKSAPSGAARNEMLMATQSTVGTLTMQRWNGSAWSVEWSATIGNSNIPRFDIAYEQTSGKALVVYSGNVAGGTTELRYRTWNGTSWTAETTFDAVRTAGTVDAVNLEPRSGTNEIGLAWADNLYDLSANYWNPTANAGAGGWVGEPTAALSASISKVGTTVCGTTVSCVTNQSFDVTFEATSGRMMVGWGDDAVLDLKYVLRTAGTVGFWGAVTIATAFVEEPTDIELAGDPNSNKIAYANNTDNGADAEFAVWSGTAWPTTSSVTPGCTACLYDDATAGTVGSGTNNISINWMRSGTTDWAVVVFDEGVAGVHWKYYNATANSWNDGAVFSTAPTPLADKTTIRARANPFNQAEMIVAFVDIGRDVFAKKATFNGTAITWTGVEGGAALELIASSVVGFSVDYAYNKYIPPPTLTQSNYRWFANADSTDVGAALAAQNTAATAPALGTAFRLRQLVAVAGNDIALNGQAFKLQYAAKGAGTCAAPGSTYADVGTTGAISYANNTTPADGATLTANANDPTAVSGTVRNQTYEEANNFTNSVAAIAAGENGKWDFALVNNSAPSATTYCFRALKSDGTVLTTYSQYPEITTAAVASGSLVTDIVDDLGASVTSPSFGMGAALSSLDCQAATGTLGYAPPPGNGQLVRVSNTTAAASWRLDLGATAGPTANWTTGTASYDFNDGSGTPAGCADGADADTLKGQLRLDPSAATIVPQTGCSSTGLTKGAATSYAQGTTDAVTLVTASLSAATNCYWNIRGIGMTQQIPGQTGAGSYSVNMTLSLTAL